MTICKKNRDSFRRYCITHIIVLAFYIETKKLSFNNPYVLRKIKILLNGILPYVYVISRCAR